MTIKEILNEYLNKKTSPLSTIRLLTGIINPDIAIDLLVIVNQICRHELGDLDTETFKALWKLQ